MEKTERLVVGVVGNPNCGKTTLFNVLTGTKQRVGNWPGVTVDRKVGYFKHQGYEIELVDLPGIYSLDVTEDSTSVDERIAQNYILSDQADLIVNIVDATNLERNLYLTTELLEIQVPLIIAVNMMDSAKQRHIHIDLPALAQQLGVTVIPLSATQHQGIETLKQQIETIAKTKLIPTQRVGYPLIIEDAVTNLLPDVIQQLASKRHAYWVALKALENDHLTTQLIDTPTREKVTHYQRKIEAELDEDIDILIADSRYAFVFTVVEKTVKKSNCPQQTLSDKIDKIMLNAVAGPLIFLAVMYLMFMFTINIGGAFIDFFDLFVGALFVEGVSSSLGSVNAPTWLITLLAEGVGGGIQVIATFIPIIGFLYLFLSFLEDSGYMARAAFVMDRFMRAIGLPGKSFVPLIVGFGCNVPAIMATRILENQRDRLLTILMSPFMSCGSRLPVYALFAAAFFPIGGQNVVFSLYLIGVGAAVFTGLIMKHTLLKGKVSHFVMELPAYHLPTARNMLLHTWDRLKRFVFGAGGVIVPMVILLTFLNTWQIASDPSADTPPQSVLSKISQWTTPAFKPLGITEDNWPATVGILTGILAKEVVVGTLDALYTQLARQEAIEEKAPLTLTDQIKQAFATIPVNLAQVAQKFSDPLGLSVGQIDNTTQAATEQSVHADTFGAMAARFDGQAGAFAYLLFILLYFPCAAATAAIYRETNLQWTFFAVIWSTGLAYIFATLFYQTATIARHPWTSMAWIGGLLALFAISIAALFFYSHTKSQCAK